MAAQNTDRELWRETEDDALAPSIHVTAQGRIGIKVGGFVYVLGVREWHDLAVDKYGLPSVDSTAFSCMAGVKFRDTIPSTNCAEWECTVCGAEWVSPSKLPCPNCTGEKGDSAGTPASPLPT